MKTLLETLRFFFVSGEAVLVAVGILIETRYSAEVSALAALIKISDEQLQYCVMIPAGLCSCTFIYGRKLLFPDGSKSSILIDWPDYWRLKAGFSAALAWSVVFFVASIIVWFADWKQPTPIALIALFVSLCGSGMCAFSVYSAQINVDEAIGRSRRSPRRGD
jgi:hypothetical protein